MINEDMRFFSYYFNDNFRFVTNTDGSCTLVDEDGFSYNIGRSNAILMNRSSWNNSYAKDIIKEVETALYLKYVFQGKQPPVIWS